MKLISYSLSQIVDQNSNNELSVKTNLTISYSIIISLKQSKFNDFFLLLFFMKWLKILIVIKIIIRQPIDKKKKKKKKKKKNTEVLYYVF